MKPQKASVALMSLLVISALTLILVTGMASAGISSYDQSYNLEATKWGYYAGEACLEEALLRIEQDSSLSAVALGIDSDTSCTATVTGTNPKTVDITVLFMDYAQDFQATISITQNGQIYNSELLTWEEI